MKQLSGIFGIYLLLLALVPCADGVFLDKGQHGNAPLEWSDIGDHDHDDDCSPLCACSCCQITISPPVTDTWLLDHAPAEMMKPSQIYTDPHSLIHVNDIWQPPKGNNSASIG